MQTSRSMAKAASRLSTVHPLLPPRLWPRVDFRCFNQFAIDLKRLATANANDLVANARIGKANPTLLVYCDAAFASDLLIGKAIASESCWQWLVERLFVTASLSPSARFDSGNVYQLRQPVRMPRG